ncbi:MAG: MOSC N-terminal beta barrel domain-containing protein [Rhodospirillales bacterium]|nr:MOSC N-terminal beta barrel domain-containing protein [Rhodospirillales bacterium]
MHCSEGIRGGLRAQSHAGALESIVRYPVKGLAGQALERVQLTDGKALPHDRRFALTYDSGAAGDNVHHARLAGVEKKERPGRADTRLRRRHHRRDPLPRQQAGGARRGRPEDPPDPFLFRLPEEQSARHGQVRLERERPLHLLG